MTGRRGVEQHVIKALQDRRVGEHRGELVERRNLHRTGAGELLLDAAQGVLGQDAAVRANDPLAIGRCSCLRIKIHDPQPGRPGNLDRLSARAQLKHIAEV